MPRLSRYKLSSQHIDELGGRIVDAALLVRDREGLTLFFNDLLTFTEKAMLGKRMLIALFLENGYSYAEISKWLKVGYTTINSISDRLHNDGRGFRLVIKKLEREKKVKEIINNINKSIATSIDIRESFSMVCSELKKIIPFVRACLIISIRVLCLTVC